jgi:hypothetical protein
MCDTCNGIGNNAVDGMTGREIILAVAFPVRHFDQRRSRKPVVGVSGRFQEDTGTVIAL